MYSKKYPALVRNQRKSMNKLSMDTAKRINKLYEKVIGELSESDFARDKEFEKNLLLAQEKLQYNMLRVMKESMGESVKVAGTTGIEFMNQIFDEVNSNLILKDPIGLLNRVQQEVVSALMDGGIYKDNLGLSSRIWETTSKTTKDIQDIVAEGLLKKKSAMDLAEDLENYVKPSAKRPTDWNKIYPFIDSAPADYNAVRLARTTINHAYQTASINTARSNPYGQYMRWLTSNAHNTCELCIERATTDHEGLGEGVYHINNIPLDHPNGMCTLVPHQPNLEDIAGDINDWIKGDSNPELDEWFDEYGEYYALGGLNIDM